MIKFSLHPKTVDQLKMVRFWLRTIAGTHFGRFSASATTFFNTDLLQRLFGGAANSPTIKFRADKMCLAFRQSHNVHTLMGPHICARHLDLTIWDKRGNGLQQWEDDARALRLVYSTAVPSSTVRLGGIKLWPISICILLEVALSASIISINNLKKLEECLWCRQLNLLRDRSKQVSFFMNFSVIATIFKIKKLDPRS
jgi:hypothetical protein